MARTYPKRQERHGLRYLPEYQVWLQLKQRCLNPKNKRYVYYGARGVTIHAEWQVSFRAFFEHVGKRPHKKLWLDRLDNSRGYEPGNVAWRTIVEQQRNRRSNLWVEYLGEKLLMAELAERVGMKRGLLRQRIVDNGWSVQRAVETPSQRRS